jgi:hypothetical protein
MQLIISQIYANKFLSTYRFFNTMLWILMRIFPLFPFTKATINPQLHLFELWMINSSQSSFQDSVIIVSPTFRRYNQPAID